eukprot:10980618-Heterocapsa_arctica.AAC.1
MSECKSEQFILVTTSGFTGMRSHQSYPQKHDMLEFDTNTHLAWASQDYNDKDISGWTSRSHDE